MIVGKTLIGEAFLGKLEVKIKDSLPKGYLTFAAKAGEPERPLGLQDNIFETIKGEKTNVEKKGKKKKQKKEKRKKETKPW
jgi:hypothetical protein